jgi:hypothetical protein
MRSPAAFAAALIQTASVNERNGSWGRATKRAGDALATVTTTAVVTPTP